MITICNDGSSSTVVSNASAMAFKRHPISMKLKFSVVVYDCDIVF
jgi:hypothetical protein